MLLDRVNMSSQIGEIHYVLLDKVNMSSQVGEICLIGQGKYIQSGMRNMSYWTR